MAEAASDAEHIHQLILEAASGARRLTRDELGRVLEHVAQAGFNPDDREQARGRLAGVVWQGRILRAGDRLPPADAHYLRHVFVHREWPPGTDLPTYLRTLEAVILDERSGVLTCRYQAAHNLQLAVVRRTYDLQGPGGHDWVMVDYRVATGHWVTAFQPADGLDFLQRPDRMASQWLRQPR